MQFDVAIIGGSFAGLSAALQIARARRPVAVIDAGEPRNRFAAHSHGFLGQDGNAPVDILATAREQLVRYPSATFMQGLVTNASGRADAFTLDLADGRRIDARRVILAAGVRDTLPDIPGLQAQWGKRVIHCPYCHGYEFGAGPFAVLATDAMAVHKAILVANWGPVSLLLNDIAVPTEEELAMLRQRDVRLVEGKVISVADAEGGLSIAVAGDRTVEVAAIFVAPVTSFAGDLPHALGCAIAQGPTGPIVEVNDWRKTSVPGVFAAGDMARMAPSVALAVADGALAGAAAHQSLVFP